MPNLRTQIANAGLKIVLNSFFRVSYSPKRMRKSFELLTGRSAEHIAKKYPQVSITTEIINGVVTETISPTGKETKTILYLHGGGYFMGSILAYRRNALRIAYHCKAKIILPEYRLAPEHPYPAALEDSLSVYRAVAQRVPKDQFIVGGDSAGGGLALSTVLKARELGLGLPSRIFCFSPWADLTGSLPSWTRNEKKDVWVTRAHCECWAKKYAGDTNLTHPGVSPLFADYRGFPPTLLFVGDQETLQDDSVMVVEKIVTAGGTARVEIGQSMQHVWPLFLWFLPEGKQAMATLGEFVN